MLGQTGTGHFSPIGAYDESNDMVLVMEVARFKYFQFWCPTSLLYESMMSVDVDTGKPRGYLRLRGPLPTGEATTLGTMNEHVIEEHRKDPKFRMCWGDAVKSLVQGLAELSDSQPLPPLPDTVTEHGRPTADALPEACLLLDTPTVMLDPGHLDAGLNIYASDYETYLEGTTVTSAIDSTVYAHHVTDLDTLRLHPEQSLLYQLTHEEQHGDEAGFSHPEALGVLHPPDPACAGEDLSHVLHTLFDGHLHSGSVALRPDYDSGLSAEELQELRGYISGTETYKFLESVTPSPGVAPLATILVMGLARSNLGDSLLPHDAFSDIRRLVARDFASTIPKGVDAELLKVAELIELSV